MTVANNPPTGLEFQLTDTKWYVPVVTLSKENDIKLSEKLIKIKNLKNLFIGTNTKKFQTKDIIKMTT